MNSFANKLKSIFGLAQNLSEETFDELADLLVEGDFGAAGAYKLTEKLKSVCGKEKTSDGEGARKALASLLTEILLKTESESRLVPGKLALILLLGVNGVGKTTTAAKLADRFMAREKRRPILAAADTFRAAAIDQLKIHGERL
ncbi:MAG: signal recognition particle receptor subunit alpha, partial [Treponema sp.]|nr:signal recognition particle receptor subunit alpha [Treponema sp.]